jgi:hypothetical protein|tara:strand:- start:115 stop:360 length:246 start_codon:yes stop_codon:yes gene_type:complete
MANWTYKTDTGVYDVEQLGDEAKVSFQYLVEVEGELQTLGKRSDVLRAAAQTFKSVIEGSLTDDALVAEEVEEAEAEQPEE